MDSPHAMSGPRPLHVTHNASAGSAVYRSKNATLEHLLPRRRILGRRQTKDFDRSGEPVWASHAEILCRGPVPRGGCEELLHWRRAERQFRQDLGRPHRKNDGYAGAELAFFGAVASVFSPLIEDRNLRWELHVDETPFDLWTIQGHFPPRAGTDDERRWMSENKASARTHP